MGCLDDHQGDYLNRRSFLGVEWSPKRNVAGKQRVFVCCSCVTCGEEILVVSPMNNPTDMMHLSYARTT